MKKLLLVMFCVLLSSHSNAAWFTKEEEDDLKFMIQEEKLAYDLYTTLAASWDFPVFVNIPNSEKNHISTISDLLNKHNLPNPNDGMQQGEFANPELQTLYATLLKKGQQSAIEAMLAGGLVEEKDILDLQKAIRQTAKNDLKADYERMTCASRNHLRAFARFYSSLGGKKYTAQLLPPDEVQNILNEPHERCGNR